MSPPQQGEGEGAVQHSWWLVSLSDQQESPGGLVGQAGVGLEHHKIRAQPTPAPIRPAAGPMVHKTVYRGEVYKTSRKKPSVTHCYERLCFVEPTGIEPATSWLQTSAFPTELRPQRRTVKYTSAFPTRKVVAARSQPGGSKCVSRAGSEQGIHPEAKPASRTSPIVSKDESHFTLL